MRFANWFLSLVILALCITPCADVLGNNLQANTTSISNISSNKDNTEHQGLDTCSPFCVCACCSTPTFTKVQVTFLYLPLPAQRTYAEFVDGNIKTASISIWQPPQLG
ncbi:DUF6660 family protein [Pedobacter caeni]|uniref:Uncharacterized protein n=1 Tax=Pedobacter caeni TaxID=288992 RepID=A0A1M5L9T5_9SPHI|nr:DUF6660 family protein [Pedobacter caeni]SHG61781.1 hypothetical protein SAMN04488522_106268 [Pedobacter caeni]